MERRGCLGEGPQHSTSQDGERQEPASHTKQPGSAPAPGILRVPPPFLSQWTTPRTSLTESALVSRVPALTIGRGENLLGGGPAAWGIASGENGHRSATPDGRAWISHWFSRCRWLHEHHSPRSMTDRAAQLIRQQLHDPTAQNTSTLKPCQKSQRFASDGRDGH